MKLNYRFSNLLGSVYRKGNVLFTGDGDKVISPVSNRISIFDLKNNTSETLSLESRLNISCLAISPDGQLLIAVNEEGEAMLCSLYSKSTIGQYKFHNTVSSVKFSPDGKYFAVTRDTVVLVFYAPGHGHVFNPFVLYRTFYGPYDETVSLDWTTDSRAFCVGSKDTNTRVFGAQKFENLVIQSLGGHNDAIVGCFFEYDSLNLYSVCGSGRVCVWNCDTRLADLRPSQPKLFKTQKDFEDAVNESVKRRIEEEKQRLETLAQKDRIAYKRIAKHSYKESRGADSPYAHLTSCDFHKRLHIIVSGFEDGAFFIHDMPDFVLIHSLSVSEQAITSLCFNPSGDWLAIACAKLGQLLIWEWQSESYILKQQGHSNNMSSLSHSPDGRFIVTGGDDGKVKVWNTTSGFCYTTFSEHAASVSAVTVSNNAKVVVSASLDGTVRAFDLTRYRNFRTFTSPRVTQFSCLSLDDSGELICAGSHDLFELYIWSMNTGRLLEAFSGHEAPVSCVSFSSGHPVLASGSWDKTVRLWDVYDNKGAKETLNFVSDVLALAFHPDGQQLAVATLDAQISFWVVSSAQQRGSIEGRHDIGYSRNEMDLITAKKSSFSKAFTSICYTADGQCLLAAGRSKNVCLYSVTDLLLLKKFEISCNMSYDGTQEFLDRSKMTEWGSLALVDESSGKDLSLPGVVAGDMSSRHWKPEVRVMNIQFSPTGRAWAAATTEGLLIYSLDHAVLFDPFQLDMSITPDSIRATLQKGEHLKALLLAVKLNEPEIFTEIIESIPYTSIEFISQSLPNIYVDKVLGFLASSLDHSRHLEFYLTWINSVLSSHAVNLKTSCIRVDPLMTLLQKSLHQKLQSIGKICDHNRYLVKYLLSVPTKRKVSDVQMESKDVGYNEERDDKSSNSGHSDSDIELDMLFE